MWMLYLFFLVPATLWFVFKYLPIYGVIIAFKDYRISAGILGSPWNNFGHFVDFFASPFSWRILRNTVILSILRVAFAFPAPIILALLINEVKSTSFKRSVQSISYLPHFMSWVVLGGIFSEILSPQRGIVSYVFSLLQQDAPLLLTNSQWFRPILISTGIWRDVGWGTVIYLAAISSVDPGLYESASIDGANRLQKMVHITVPSIAPAITIIFILSLGNIMEAGFDQVFNLYNPLVYEVADIIDTYVYRVGLLERKYDFTAAIGLFQNVLGVILLVGANAVIKRFSDYGVW